MKSLLILTLFGLCLFAAGPAPAAAQGKDAADRVKREFAKAKLISFYDAANDVTGVYTVAMGLTGRWGDSTGPQSLLAASLGARPEGVRFTVYFTCPGKVFTPPREVRLRLASTSRRGPGFSAGGEVEVAVVADGAGLGPGRSAVETKSYGTDAPRPGTEYVEQTLEIPLTVAEFGRLAAAKKAEVVIAGGSIPFKGRHLKALRRIADVIAGAK